MYKKLGIKISLCFADWIIQSKYIGKETLNVYNFPLKTPIRNCFGKLSLRSFQWCKIWSLEKRAGLLVINPLIFKNYKIPTNVTDENTKFSTKFEHCNPWFMWNIYIYDLFEIYMFTLSPNFVHCIKKFRVYSFVWFCFTWMKVMFNSMHYFLK